MNPSFDQVDGYIQDFVSLKGKARPSENGRYYTGVDLGTACVVLAVLNEKQEPVFGQWRYADVVRDGMVVDYLQAIRLVQELKDEAEAALGTELDLAAAAIPPGTDTLDGGVVKNVLEGAGFELRSLSDESTAANEVLTIKNGAVVDIGGGTTGISVFRDGEVVYTADEATGGTHFTLVLAGSYKISFEEAELYKRNSAHHAEILPVLRPSIEKVAAIIKSHIKSFDVPEIYLVGGTACLEGMEGIIAAYLGTAEVYKPKNPMFVTPLGIAKSCVKAVRKEVQ